MRVRRMIDISPPSRASGRQAVPDGRRFSPIRKERSRPCRHAQLLPAVRIMLSQNRHSKSGILLLINRFFVRSGARRDQILVQSMKAQRFRVRSGAARAACQKASAAGLQPLATPIYALWAVHAGSRSETTPTNHGRRICRSWTTPHAPFEIARRDCWVADERRLAAGVMLGHLALDDLARSPAAQGTVTLAPLQSVCLHRLHDLEGHRQPLNRRSAPWHRGDPDRGSCTTTGSTPFPPDT